MKPIRLICAALLAIGLPVLAHAADPTSLRIGYQKGSIGLVLAKEQGLLEKRFPATQVQWIEFPAGPQMLEALNVGALDVGSTGDIPRCSPRPPAQIWSTSVQNRPSHKRKPCLCLRTVRCIKSPT